VSSIQILFGLLALECTVPAFAATSMHQSSLNLCHSGRSLTLQIWQHDLYAAPPDVSSIMVDAMDGKTAAVRKALVHENTKDISRWRQLAMNEAALAGQTDVVDALLDDGAKADDSALVPPLKSAFYNRVVGQIANDPQIGQKAVKGLQAAGLMNNETQQTGPAIYMAIDCDDLAMVKVLLRHGADPMRKLKVHGADPFIAAISDGDADIIQAFLDHGADPCLEDHRLADNAKDHHLPKRTISDIGASAGLPTGLIQHLTCHALPPSN